MYTRFRRFHCERSNGPISYTPYLSNTLIFSLVCPVAHMRVCAALECFHWAVLVALLLSFLTHGARAIDKSEEAVQSFFGNSTSQGHTNNWAVLVCSSRYWFNYRVGIMSNMHQCFLLIISMKHIANVLGMSVP